MRIALVAVLAVAAVWFAVLRPTAEEPIEPAPVVHNAPPASVAKPVVEPAAASTPRTAAKPVQVGGTDPSAPLLAQLDKGRAVVLLFWNRNGADDVAVHGAVRAVEKSNHRVVAKVAAIDDVARYEAITTGVQVLTAPTVLVIGPDKRAKAIEGYTDAKSLRQAIGDALRG